MPDERNKLVEELLMFGGIASAVFLLALKIEMDADCCAPEILQPIHAIFYVFHVDASEHPWRASLAASLIYGAVIWSGMKVYYKVRNQKSSEQEDSFRRHTRGKN